MITHKTNLVLGVAALVVGAFIYILFRDGTYLGKVASNIWLVRVMRQFLLPCDSAFVNYYLPDFLWAFSLASILQLTLQTFAFGKMLSGVTAVACGIMWECLQICGVVTGTGDLWDIVMYLLAGILSIYINCKECRK